MLKISHNRTLLNNLLSVNLLGNIYIETKDIGSIAVSQKSILGLLDCQSEAEKNILKEWFEQTQMVIDYAKILECISVINKFISEGSHWLTLNGKNSSFTRGESDFLNLEEYEGKNELKEKLKEIKENLLLQINSILLRNDETSRTLDVDQKGSVIVVCENIDVSLRLTEKQFKELILDYLKDHIEEGSRKVIENLFKIDLSYLNIKKPTDIKEKISIIFDETIKRVEENSETEDLSDIFINFFISELLNKHKLRIEEYDDTEDE